MHALETIIIFFDVIYTQTVGPDSHADFIYVPDSQYDGPMAQSIPVDRRGNVYVPDGFKQVDIVKKG